MLIDVHAHHSPKSYTDAMARLTGAQRPKGWERLPHTDSQSDVEKPRPIWRICVAATAAHRCLSPRNAARPGRPGHAGSGHELLRIRAFDGRDGVRAAV